MRILIHGLNFAPELTGIGKYTGELAVFLVESGHQVRVVTTPPYYPLWRIAPGYSPWTYRKETWQGVEVYRCPLWVPRRPSGITRLLHLATYALSSLPVMLAQARWKPDLVFCVAPALAAAPVSAITARLSKAKAWLHIQDFELEAAARLGLLPGGDLGQKAFSSLETAVYRGFQRISTISQRMLQHLHAKGVAPRETCLFPNWVDETCIYPLPEAASLRAEWQVGPDQKLVLYSGNMGQKQGLETLLACARLLREESDLAFLLCGDGSARPALEGQARDLPNVRFLPLQPIERLNELLNLADIHVLPQRADAADLVMPSKLGGMLASGKAVVATARPETELAQVIGQAGLLVPPEDPAALAEAVRRLARQPDLRRELGRRGREYVVQHWSKNQVLDRFHRDMRALLDDQDSGTR